MILVVVLQLNTCFLLQDEAAEFPHSVFCSEKELGIILGNGIEKSLPFLNQALTVLVRGMCWRQC